jgi:hypothetical protein
MECAKHLRFIQFSLVTTCAAIWVAASLTSPRVDRAVRDLRAICSISASWDDRWLETEGRKLAEDKGPQISDSLVGFDVSFGSWNSRLTFNELVLPVILLPGRGSFAARVLTPPPPGDNGAARFKCPQTLHDFEVFWDELNQPLMQSTYTHPADSGVAAVMLQDPDPSFVFSTARSTSAPIADQPREQPEKTLWRQRVMSSADLSSWMLQLMIDPSMRGRVMTRLEAFEPCNSAYYAYGEFHTPQTVGWLAVPCCPVTTQYLTSAQQLFNRRYLVDFPEGVFEESFESLSELTRGYRNKELTALQPIIQSETSSSEGNIQLFGVSLPSYGIVKLGALVILAIHLYLVIHLWELARFPGDISRPSEIGWIGLYRGWLARSVTIVSSSALPSMVVCAMIYRGTFFHLDSVWGTWLTNALAISISLALSAATIYFLTRLWRQTQAAYLPRA